MKHIENDLYTTMDEMTVPQMKRYLKEMKERSIQLENRLMNVDKETESLESAIQRATFQRSIIGDAIDDSEFSSKSDRVFYILERAKEMIREQAMDIADQTCQINEEKRKIANIKFIIGYLSYNSRIAIKAEYFEESEWGADEESVRDFQKISKFDCKQAKYRTLTSAVAELTEHYNQEIITRKKDKKRSVCYSVQSVTVEES